MVALGNAADSRFPLANERTVIDAGASATSCRRKFQRMIEAGTSKPTPFDIAVVHSFSHCDRDLPAIVSRRDMDLYRPVGEPATYWIAR